MKKLFITIFLLTACSVYAQTAKIKIDVTRVVGEIDPKIYGVFMEPIGRRGNTNTVYGNLYNPSSPLADADGFRKDYIDAMKELKIPCMRWPGGNFVMGYNWQDGIGPKDQRPTRINLAWGAIETNHVGTDEWFALNKSIGSENVVCVNLGLSTIMDACYWVEYCNYDKGTYYSDLRAKNGHPEPYNAKIWDLGNEVDGSPWELGHKKIEEYVSIGREAAKAMKSVDKSIKLVASGSSHFSTVPPGEWVTWNRRVLEEMGDMIDYISIHRYWENSRDYYTYIGQSAKDFEEKITVTAAEIEAVSAMKNFKNPIYISFDEWGSFGRSMLNVLPVAQCLNAFIRHADVVKMANFTMLTSLLASDKDKGSFKSPLFQTYKLFSVNCRGNSIDTYVECDTFNTAKYNGVSFLDVTSVYSKDTKTVYVNVVNRHQDKAITADIISNEGAFTGKAEATFINSDSLTDPFTYDKKDQYNPVVKEVDVKGNKLSYSFPAHSFTQIKVKVLE